MIQNYFKTAWRNLKRNKLFSVINIAGLAAGVACCLLLIIYINYQLGFDKFHSKSDRIVRVLTEFIKDNSSDKTDVTSSYVFPNFKKHFPEIENGVRMEYSSRIIKYGDKNFEQQGFLLADSTFFDVFDFKLLKGNPSEVLKTPYSLVLSESIAGKYFGNEDPVGKTMLVGASKKPALVTGVAEDCPANSQIQYNMICSFSSLGKQALNTTYLNANYNTYLLLKNKKNLSGLQAMINKFMVQEAGSNSSKIRFELEPFNRIHLHSPYDAMVPNVSMSYLYIIGGIALLILAIACFTYINLSVAGSIRRAKEVGMRKISGAYKKQIFWQFISESLVITVVAVLTGIGLALICIKPFNTLAQTSFSTTDIFNSANIIAAMLLVVLITFLAGSYPALLLSGFREIKILKGGFKSSSSGNVLRKALIVFQFTISIFLIISTIVIKGQLQYIQQKKLGYDKEHVLVVSSLNDDIRKRMAAFKSELLTNPQITMVSGSEWSPVSIKSGYSIGENVTTQISVNGNKVDEDFLRTNNIELVAGKGISPQDIKDVSNENDSLNTYRYLLNESAVKAMGWTPAEAIGKKIVLMSDRKGEVIGVVKDFHFASMHTPISPLVLIPANWVGQLLIKTKGQNLQQAIRFVENKFKQWSPDIPFDYHFLDDEFNDMYSAEMRIGKVVSIFSALAIILACMGLFGLSAFSTQQRIKEIGIRKTLGASVLQISSLLTGGFMKLVLIAF
ncbi:MAG TPA: hypothetical protein DCQ50_18725, partial [Chryseobacterium sp.]|nr:hypothetical protein [Chryseobacterium sp.]